MSVDTSSHTTARFPRSLDASGRRPRCLAALSQWAVVRNPSHNRTHLHKAAQVLGTPVPSPDDTGTRGWDAPVKELKVINVAWAPARFRAFPDDTGIALNGDKPVARVGPILKLLDGHVIAGLPPGTTGEEPAGY
jgi:hypothetical protein